MCLSVLKLAPVGYATKTFISKQSISRAVGPFVKNLGNYSFHAVKKCAEIYNARAHLLLLNQIIAH